MSYLWKDIPLALESLFFNIDSLRRSTGLHELMPEPVCVLALMIHCSCTCRDILIKVGGYMLEERGKVKVKGKGEMTTYWLTGEDPEIKQHREWSRRQRGFQDTMLAKNGCVGGIRGSQGLRGSMRSNKSKPLPLPRTLSLESPKRLRFAMSEELPTKVVEVAKEERDVSPPPPSSPASDDCTVRRINLEVKRNSCPCIKEHHMQLRGAAASALGSPSLLPSSSDKKTLTPTNNMDLPISPASGDEEVLTASRRTSMSEVVVSRPSSLVETNDDQVVSSHTSGEPSCHLHPTTFGDEFSPLSQSSLSQPTSSTTCIPTATSVQDQSPQDCNSNPFNVAISSSPSRTGSRLAGVSSTVPSSNLVVGARYSVSGNGSGKGSMGNGNGSGTSRWRPHSVVPLGLRNSPASSEALPTLTLSSDVSESRVPRLRYCSKQEACSTATDCEESSPLLSSVVNYRVINEVQKLPDRETPV